MARGAIYGTTGNYRVVLDVGRSPLDKDGKPLPAGKTRRLQTTKRGFQTKRDAERWLTEQLGRLERGTYVQPSRQTFGEYLTAWLPAIRSSVRPATWESYERNIRRHLVPRLGHVPLQQLGPDLLNAVYAELHRGGRLNGKGGLSARSVRYLHTIVFHALRDALAEGKVTRNVAALDLVSKRLPRKVKHEMTTWTAEQVTVFLDQLVGDRMHMPVSLMLATGMRRGEILGLRWSDVDLDAGHLSVRQTLSAPRNPDTGEHLPVFQPVKTEAGERQISLDAQTVAELREHRAAQLEERMQYGLGRPAADGLVFTEEDGQPIHPDRFRKRFEIRRDRSGLPKIRIHDLRHTHATLGLRAGVHPKIMSRRLGHASIAITLDTYTHAIPDMDQEAAETVTALYRRA